MGNLLGDVRYCLRGFARRPIFAAVVVVTLAIGIGINVAMYSIFQGMVLRPIPGTHEPHALVNLGAPGRDLKQGNTACNLAGDCEEVFSYPMFRDLERVQEPFTAIAAHHMVEVNLALRGETLSGTGVLVSGNYFGVLGVKPELGRLLGPEDDAVEGNADAVVLSYRYWQNALGADPGVVGQALVVNGKPLTIVGVAGREFQGTSRPASPEVFLPITFRWRDVQRTVPNFDDRRYYWAYLFARLKPGVLLEQAEAAINTPYRAILSDVEAPLQLGMTEQTLTRFRAKTITVSPGARGQSWIMSGADVPLAILLVAVGTVLLIACLNIANLMLARGATRVGEMAMRLSLGAEPRRLVALLFALFPVLKLARTQPGQILHSQSTRSTGGKAANRFRVGLVTAQIAMSMMLLVLAGMFAQSLANAAREDLGMRVDSLLSFSISPERNGYTSSNAAALFTKLEEDLAALPGVTHVASSLLTLLANNSTVWDVRAPGFEVPPGTRAVADFNGVSPRFFETLDIPLRAGRDFAAADGAPDRPRVAIVNQRFVERFAFGANAVGTRIGAGQGDAYDIEIVGVVADAKYDNVKEPIAPQLFLPRGQFERAGTLTFYVRTAGEPEAAAETIRKVVRSLDSNLPIMNMQTVDRQVRENLFLDRFMGTLAVALAVLATLLAAVGLYGVLSYMIAQRTREIGLRMALGAPPARLRGMVLRQVGGMAVVGGVIGIGAAVMLGQAASALLFGVQASDPLVLSAAVGVLAAIVFGAGYLPARRASRVDPMTALRSE